MLIHNNIVTLTPVELLQLICLSLCASGLMFISAVLCVKSFSHLTLSSAVSNSTWSPTGGSVPCVTSSSLWIASSSFTRSTCSHTSTVTSSTSITLIRKMWGWESHWSYSAGSWQQYNDASLATEEPPYFLQHFRDDVTLLYINARMFFSRSWEQNVSRFAHIQKRQFNVLSGQGVLRCSLSAGNKLSCNHLNKFSSFSFIYSC